jgi:hypothetical protein
MSFLYAAILTEPIRHPIICSSRAFLISHSISHKYSPKSATYDELKKHIGQPTEFEATAVGAYFFLSYTDKKRLNDIMSSGVSTKRKMELLINAYMRAVYRYQVDLF